MAKKNTPTLADNQELRDAITAQALKEIVWARKYKQGKVKNWQINEQMYYGVKLTQPDARANVELGRMQEFVHTLLSKIRRPLVFKFTKRKNSQQKRVKLLNALREIDRKVDHWDLKELVGKKQMAIYGRKVFSYYADSIDGIYRSHNDNVDVYDFLIDPAAGGIDLEQGLYMGDYGVVLMRDQLESGRDEGIYFAKEVDEILQGVGNNTETPQEETNKLTRMFGQNTIGKKELQQDDKFKFWRWFTTYKGVRYYLLMQERAGRAVEVRPLTEMFSATQMYPKAPWPYWTAAAFPDLTEFWTPSYCDYVREIFMAQNVSIDQALDNSEAINKPMRKVNVNAIEDMSKLKYRKDGIIPVKGDFDVNQAYQIVETPEIDTPLKVFDKLEAIHEKASGVNANAKGSSDPDGKVAIYEGNKAEMADRFGLFDMSYSFGYDRFATLYEIGVRDHLTKRVAIELVGPDGIEVEEVNRRDLFKKGDQYGVMVESSADELALTQAEKTERSNFIQTYVNADNAAANAHSTAQPLINHRKAFEIQARIHGIKTEEITELLDVSEYSNSDILSEADRDIESLLNGEKIKPNPAANAAYMQRFVDFLTDEADNMSPEMFKTFTDYMDSLGDNIAVNAARAVQKHFIDTMMSSAGNEGVKLPPNLDVKSITTPPLPNTKPTAPGAAVPPTTPALPAIPSAQPVAPAPINLPQG